MIKIKLDNTNDISKKERKHSPIVDTPERNHAFINEGKHVILGKEKNVSRETVAPTEKNRKVGD